MWQVLEECWSSLSIGKVFMQISFGIQVQWVSTDDVSGASCRRTCGNCKGVVLLPFSPPKPWLN